MSLTLEDLDHPDFLQLPPEEQYKGRREVFHDLQKNDANFRALPSEERQKVLFPNGAVPVAPAVPKPTMGEALKEGWDTFKTPGRGPFPLSVAPQILGAAQMIGSPLQPVANAVTSGAERISDAYKDTPDRMVRVVFVSHHRWQIPAAHT